MSQREALLQLHGSRRRPRSDDTDELALVQELYGLPGADVRQRSVSADPVSDVAADPVVGLASTEQVVLDAEILEALVAFARHSEDRAAFASDGEHVTMAERLVVDTGQASDLLGVVFDIRDDKGLAEVQHGLTTGPTGRAAPQHEAPSPHAASHQPTHGIDLLTAPPTTLSIAREALLAADIDLVPPLLDQPGARCLARLVPVELAGEGEYAISFRTDVCFEMPDDLSVEEFVADLFEPSNWPKRHSFWISMDEILPDHWTDGARDLVQRMAEVQPLAETAGVHFGHRRVYNEAVGNRNNEGGTWPGTVLVFTDSHRPGIDGGLNHHYLEYRLVPGISPYLLLDDGTIQVTEDGTNVCCTVTKMLFFSERKFSTQAEVMADYACISGWAEQTREFLMNWIGHKRNTHGGTA